MEIVKVREVRNSRLISWRGNIPFYALLTIFFCSINAIAIALFEIGLDWSIFALVGMVNFLTLFIWILDFFLCYHYWRQCSALALRELRLSKRTEKQERKFRFFKKKSRSGVAEREQSFYHNFLLNGISFLWLRDLCSISLEHEKSRLLWELEQEKEELERRREQKEQMKALENKLREEGLLPLVRALEIDISDEVKVEALRVDLRFLREKAEGLALSEEVNNLLSEGNIVALRKRVVEKETELRRQETLSRLREQVASALPGKRTKLEGLLAQVEENLSHSRGFRKAVYALERALEE